jgi:3-hydroxybutyryl-CoA dehydrogenase
MHDVNVVGVLGCGLMGSGITQAAAQTGYRTIVLEADEALLHKGLGRIERFLSDGVSRGKVTEDVKAAALAHITGSTRYDDLKECDLVIEAITENLDAKRAAYRQLEAVLKPDAVIASNTSSLCITELAASTTRPDRFGGLHFFNPVPLMKLVEVIRALTTSDATHSGLVAFARTLGKEPIQAPDRPGFIVNRLLVPYLLDAVRAYENGVGSIEDIDNGMKLGCGHPMGPFTLLDFVGIDTTYYIANIMYDEFREPAYAPPPLMKRMVLAGHVGRKVGRGFYRYEE